MKRIRDNAPHTRRTDVPFRIAVFTLLCWLLPIQASTEPSSEGLPPSVERPSPLDGTAPDRIVAFADVHGGFTELEALLGALTLIDGNGNWIGGRTRLISLGDLLDRGPDSRAVMDLLMRLETQAAEAGGAVHLVLGNHELMNLTGDLRYVADAEYAAFAADEDPAARARAFATFKARLAEQESAEQTTIGIPTPGEPEAEVDAAAEFEARFPPGYFAHRAAFAADGVYGRWLLSKPQILELERTAFVHGGLSTAFIPESIESFNASASDDLRALLLSGAKLVDGDLLPPWEDLLTSRPERNAQLPAEMSALRASLPFQLDGPAWYRGSAACHPLIERPRFEAVLAARGLDRVVMGHTPTAPRIIQTRFEERAVLADTGMYRDYYRGRPSALIIDQGKLQALTLTEDGRLIARRGRPTIDIRAEQPARPRERLAAALADVALTPGEKTVFTANGRRMDATWHREGRRQRSSRLAAQALDERLGFGLIAPVILIERDGVTGVVEVVPSTALSEQARVTGNVYRPNYCQEGSDFDLLLILDGLMGQEHRSGTNVAYDRTNWLIYLTEQDRTFPKTDRLPRYLENQNVMIPALVAERLAALTAEALSTDLDAYLDRRQIQAILSRRDRLLAEWSVRQEP